MIRVEDLEVVYPNGTRGLAPTTLMFESGVFTVFLGASGAGKSTLLRALNGLVRPTRGRVLIDGIGTLSGSRNIRTHRRRTGMVFQQHQLIGRATRAANVLTGRLGYHSGFRTLLPFRHTRSGSARRHRTRRPDRLCAAPRRSIVRRPATTRRYRASAGARASADPRRRAGREPRSGDCRPRAGAAAQICKADGITAIVSLHQLEFAAAMPTASWPCAWRVVFDGPPGSSVKREILHIYGATRRQPATCRNRIFNSRQEPHA